MPVYFSPASTAYSERPAANGLLLREALWRHFCGSNNYLGTDMERTLEVQRCQEIDDGFLLTLYEERANQTLECRFDTKTGRILPQST